MITAIVLIGMLVLLALGTPVGFSMLISGTVGLLMFGGPPMALGAAIGAPGRRVINMQADGAAMYTVQALWTQAREGLDVTTVLFSNRCYQILKGELANVGAGNPGRKALDMLDLGRPDLSERPVHAAAHRDGHVAPPIHGACGDRSHGRDSRSGMARLGTRHRRHLLE